MAVDVDWADLNERLATTIGATADPEGLAAAEFDLIVKAVGYVNEQLRGFQLEPHVEFSDLDQKCWSTIEVKLTTIGDYSEFPYSQQIKRKGAREVTSFRAGDGRGYTDLMKLGAQSIDYWISVLAELVNANAPRKP